jgi:hypothetical protein
MVVFGIAYRTARHGAQVTLRRLENCTMGRTAEKFLQESEQMTKRSKHDKFLYRLQ